MRSRATPSWTRVREAVFGLAAALVVVVTFGVARSFFYCPMREAATVRCCCGGMGGMGSMGMAAERGAPEDAISLRKAVDGPELERRCCERVEAQAVGSTAAWDTGSDLAPSRPAAVLVAVPPPPRPVMRPRIGFVPQRVFVARHGARASPARRGKRRALLGVTQC